MDITGVGRDYFYGKKLQVIEGRGFTEQDNQNMNRVLMIDDYTREKLFKDDEEIIGEIIEIYGRSEEHTSELQSRGHLVCRLLLEKKKQRYKQFCIIEILNITIMLDNNR